jgi:hypothetical protein
LVNNRRIIFAVLNLITRMKKLENIKNIFYGVVMLAFLAPTILGARVYAATETQKEDVKKNSQDYDGESQPCTTKRILCRVYQALAELVQVQQPPGLL